MQETSGRYRRITEWWRPKGGVVFSLLLFYLALWDVPFGTAWKLLVFSVITLVGFGLTGYFLNDWADIPYDNKVGKTNLVDGIPKLARPFALLVLLVITFFPWLVYFKYDGFSIALICGQLLLQFAYPVPPVRIKQYPIPAMLADSLYALGIPTVLAWHTMDLTAGLNDNSGQWMHFMFLFLWMTATGVRHILNHHVVDKENDRLTNTPNIALRVEPLRLREIVQSVLFPLELLTAMLFFSLLMHHSGLLPMLPLVILIGLGASRLLSNSFGFNVGFWKTSTDGFASLHLGLLSLLFLVLEDAKFLLVAVPFILLFSNIGSHPILTITAKGSWKRIKVWLFFPWEFSSLMFNWALYYFRKFILNWSEERNWGEHYALRLEKVKLDAKGNIAIFNQNYSKYSETFISGQLSDLDYRIRFYYGWPKPINASKSGDLISNEPYLRKSVLCKQHVMNVDVSHFEDVKIAEDLIENDIRLLLVNFGTMAVSLLNVARMTGIPLVVIFHGYDAWNKKEVETYHEQYTELFSIAEAVVGVSRDICKRLKELGCPNDKIIYQPALVNRKFFECEPVAANDDPKFLYVGRFSRTKAPHLVLLAFKHVLEKLPESKLVMIGADDGEGLFEACQMMATAEGISDKITFRGQCSSEEVFNEMRSGVVFVQHSVTTPLLGDKEGTPVGIMEAMALGLPIVATKHAGIAELIEHEHSGILVKESDLDAMANEMVRVASDKALREKLGQNAAKSIRENQFVYRSLENLSDIIDRYKVKK